MPVKRSARRRKTSAEGAPPGGASKMMKSLPSPCIFVKRMPLILPVKYGVASRNPRVGFVSLGCPKALVDSERILTQLRAEGYATSPSYAGADLVIVNTCGFIDAAVEESLDAIGEALAENGRVVVTGCLGVKQRLIKDAHPAVLAITGPHDTAAVMQAV